MDKGGHVTNRNCHDESPLFILGVIIAAIFTHCIVSVTSRHVCFFTRFTYKSDFHMAKYHKAYLAFYLRRGAVMNLPVWPMAHTLQHNAIRIVPKGRIIAGMILREFPGRMNHLGTEFLDLGMDGMDRVA